MISSSFWALCAVGISYPKSLLWWESNRSSLSNIILINKYFHQKKIIPALNFYYQTLRFVSFIKYNCQTIVTLNGVDYDQEINTVFGPVRPRVFSRKKMFFSRENKFEVPGKMLVTARLSKMAGRVLIQKRYKPLLSQ